MEIPEYWASRKNFQNTAELSCQRIYNLNYIQSVEQGELLVEDAGVTNPGIGTRINKPLTAETSFDVTKTRACVLEYGTCCPFCHHCHPTLTGLEVTQRKADAEEFYVFMTLLSNKNNTHE